MLPYYVSNRSGIAATLAKGPFCVWLVAGMESQCGQAWT